MDEIGTVNNLVSELLANGNAKANNAAKLLALMATCKQEAALKAAIQGLKQFFVAAGQDGLLKRPGGSGARPAKRQKVDAAAAAAAAAPADAEAQYREWLGRQYDNYVSQLLSLATGFAIEAPARQKASGAVAPAPDSAPARSVSAGVQVVAAAALMECVRSEQGPGVFSGSLYGRLLSGVLLCPAVRPEVFALLFTKYLQMADVRFYTLATVKAVAARHGGAKVQQQQQQQQAAGEKDEEAAEDKDGGDEGEAGASRAANAMAADAAAAAEDAAAAAADAAAAAAARSSGGGSGGGGGAISLPDLARNLYDVLCHMTDTLPADTSEWSTWCGAAEYNLVTAAADKNESAKLRRKRKQQEQRQAEGGGQQQQSKASQQKAQWANALTQRRLYGDAWLSLLALPLPPDVLRKSLLRLPASVIPYMTGPQLLADFLTHCLNRGGLTGMLALNGIFLLVTRHGLEYPQFFARLYQLLVPEAFAARSRAQFFRLADIFLSSSLVPAYTVAAFVKRFARLALGAPPPGAMIAIAFVHNLIRRHPALAVMLHNPAAAAAADAASSGDGDTAAAAAAPCGGEGGRKGARGAQAGKGAQAGPGVDPYDEGEADPAKSRAVESSLWEVEALRNHYCPQVSTFCAVLDKDLTDRAKTAEVNLEDLLGAAKVEGQQPGGAGSYSALIQGEMARKLRKVPVAFYSQPPTTLFAAGLDADDWAGWAITQDAAK